MKTIFAVSLILLATFFAACERNDYQHPGYRSGQLK
jgi:hypothetical protein